MDDFRELESHAKLVCFVDPGAIALERESPSRLPKGLMAMAAAFGGPTLRLPKNPEQSKIEIAAAIDAMMPLKK